MNEIILLAGGLGTRLRSVVSDRPKPMSPVAGKPFLEWQMRDLVAAGADRFVLATGYLGEQIEDHFGSSFLGKQVVYSRERTPLGTGGAVRQALTLTISEMPFVMNADTFVQFSFAELQSPLIARNAEVAIALIHFENAQRFGSVRWDEKTTQITGFLASGAAEAGWINAGCYCLRKPYFLRDTPEGSFSIEADYFQRLVNKSRFFAVPIESPFIDIGVPEEFLRAQSFVPDLIRKAATHADGGPSR